MSGRATALEGAGLVYWQFGPTQDGLWYSGFGLVWGSGNLEAENFTAWVEHSRYHWFANQYWTQRIYLGQAFSILNLHCVRITDKFPGLCLTCRRP